MKDHMKLGQKEIMKHEKLTDMGISTKRIQERAWISKTKRLAGN